MKTIPTYALYGETDSPTDWLHWETIQARSRPHGYRIAPHRHESFFQILLLTGGAGEVVIDGARFDLEPGTAVAIPALTVHGYVFSTDVEGLVVTLMERDIAGLGLTLPEAGIVVGAETIAARLTGLIAEADNPGDMHDVAMQAHLTLLLVALARTRREVAPDSEGADRARHHAQTFRQLVDRDFRKTRRIADYAGAVGISATHLNRVCRDILGMSALDVIEKRIALEARRQLLFSELTVKQIGADLGYDDPAYFTRFFTRRLGVPPASFRRAGRSRSSADLSLSA